MVKCERTTPMYIPEGVLMEVLSKLPVESLLRSRCVSKQWRTLIDSSILVKKHLHHSLKTKSNLNIIFTNSYANIDSLEINPNAMSHKLFCPSYVVDRVHFASESFWSRCVFMGSCNGLVLLCHWNINPVVWNPATRKHRIISPMPPYADAFAWGFGYDRVSDDYKVVCIAEHGKSSAKLETVVYSLKWSTWWKLPNYFTRDDLCPYWRLSYGGGVFTNGSIHWLAGNSTNSQVWIVALDIENEEYKLISLPDQLRFRVLALRDLDGALCVFDGEFADVYDVWVMKEYGKKESWTKLLSPLEAMPSPLDDYCFPITYSKIGKQVLLADSEGRRLAWYDLETQSLLQEGEAGSLSLPKPTFDMSDLECIPIFRYVASMVQV